MHDVREASGARWLGPPPAPSAGGRARDIPESSGYRLKRLLLGPPLVSEDLIDERLGKPTALAVLSSDVMSSCAYATESILRVLVPAAGAAAFALVTPITGILLLVLGIVCLCYRQVVKSYPVAGGSYVVSRDNFGYAVAQIPAAALLLSYVLTVAVSVAAGVDAVISAFPVLSPYPTELSVLCVVLLTYGNLRGIREAGRVFAVPTYLFLATMAVLVIAGVVRLAVAGHLHQYSIESAGHLHPGHAGAGLLLGTSLFIFMRAFANGGSAMTGMEAISNSVTLFRDPQVKNARATLVTMASILGAMFIAVSIFASLTHASPFESGTPTVLSQIGRTVFGTGPLAEIPYYALQFTTALILILGANTSYNGFPQLVSFVARDTYLPRPLTTRGHRLVFSNGIGALAVASILLLVVTDSKVADLIPLYACTVFTGFTMAGAGMTKHHLTRRGQQGYRSRDLWVSAAAFVVSAVVTLIFVVTEFTRGAWLVVVAVPLIVLVLTRTHRRYEEEKEVLAEDVAQDAQTAPVLRRHVVLVLVDSLDLATARAVQLARSLGLTNEVRAVHFVIDTAHADVLVRRWGELGMPDLPLEVVYCPDRRLARAATELCADLSADGETEVTLVLPRRIYRGIANRLLHSHTADRIVAAVGVLPHVSATIAPFDVGGLLKKRRAAPDGGPTEREESQTPPGGRGAPEQGDDQRLVPVAGATPIGDLVWRERMRVAGRVQSVRVQPRSGVSTLECTLVDGTGAVSLVFLGRRSIPGIEPGAQLEARGRVGRHEGHLAIINPMYELLTPAARSRPPTT